MLPSFPLEALVVPSFCTDTPCHTSKRSRCMRHPRPRRRILHAGFGQRSSTCDLTSLVLLAVWTRHQNYLKKVRLGPVHTRAAGNESHEAPRSDGADLLR